MDEAIIVETIKRMKDSGLEDDIIISTLEDVGISREKAQELINKASGLKKEVPAKKEEEPKTEEAQEVAQPEALLEEAEPEEAEELTEEESKAKEKIELPVEIESEETPESPTEAIKAHLQEAKLEQDLQHTTMQAALVQHTSMLDDIHKSLQNVATQKPECPKAMNEQIVKIQTDIEKIKTDLAEAKADIAAMKELMSKVLDSTKKLLLRMP